MYAAPPAVVPVAAPRRGGFAGVPILAICCLLTILFLIAATIVLALIPIYLPSKQATNGLAAPYYFTFLPGQTLPDGSLDATARQNIGYAIDRALGYPLGTTVVTEVLVRQQNTRKRRSLNLHRRRRATRSVCIGTAQNNPRTCSFCRIPRGSVSVLIDFFYFGFQIVGSFIITFFGLFPDLSTSPATATTIGVTSPTTTTQAAGGVTTTTQTGGVTTTTASDGVTTTTTPTVTPNFG